MSSTVQSAWMPSPTQAYVTPQSLVGVAVVVLLTVLCILSALLVYVYYRRRLRGSGPRMRRPRGTSNTAAAPVEDAEIIVDDYRRGSRPTFRRQLPWLLGLISPGGQQRPPVFPDTQHSRFAFLIALDWLWSRAPPPVEPIVDDLPDVAPYDDGQTNAAGPRFLATTASGKSLQVVVKTATVASRQQHKQLGQSQGVGNHDPLATSQSWHASTASDRSATADSASRHLLMEPSLSASDADAKMLGARSLPAICVHTSWQAVPSVSSSSAAGSGGGGKDAHLCASGPLAGRQSVSALWQQHVSRASLDASEAETQPVVVARASGGADLQERAAAAGSCAGGRLSALGSRRLETLVLAAGEGFSKVVGSGMESSGARGWDIDPAVAWYSRALHREVSAAAAATQAEAADASKVHIA